MLWGGAGKRPETVIVGGPRRQTELKYTDISNYNSCFQVGLSSSQLAFKRARHQIDIGMIKASPNIMK